MRVPIFAFALALAGTTLMTVAGPRAAMGDSKHNTEAPIDFDAGHIELQDKANRAVLTSNVIVRQAEMTLNAERVTVAYTGQVVNGSPEVTRLDAVGGVVITRPDQRARGDYAIYDVSRRTITMLGSVNLAQGTNVVNGGRLTLNLDTGRAMVDGSAVGNGSGTMTSSNGRVTGRFSVPKRNTP